MSREPRTLDEAILAAARAYRDAIFQAEKARRKTWTDDPELDHEVNLARLALLVLQARKRGQIT